MAKNEVAPKEAKNEIAQIDLGGDDFFGGVTVGKQDMLIPKLLPMQGMSDLVTAGKAIMGEFRDSVNGDLLGHINEGVEIVPFFVTKNWDIMKKDPKGKWKYQKMIPVVEDATSPDYNANLDPFEVWQDPADGIDMRRVYRLNFFVLLKKDIEAGKAFPYVLAFKSTSLAAGKALMTEAWSRNRDAGKYPFSDTFIIGGKRETGDEGTYIVLSITRGTAASREAMVKAADWFKRIRTAKDVVIDDSDERKSAPPQGESSSAGLEREVAGEAAPVNAKF